MKVESRVLLLAVGGGAGQILERVAGLAGEGLRAVAMDTDAVSLSGLSRVEKRLLGAVRLEGIGAGGDAVSGRLAAQDDVSMVKATLGGARFMVLLTTLGGGTGGGAAPEILAHARQAGITTLCFASLPFGFEGRKRLGAAERIVPLLEDAADTLVVLRNDELYAEASDVSLDEALRKAAFRIEAGLLMLWRMLSRPGFIRLDERELRGLLTCGGGGCRYAYAAFGGAERARKTGEALITSAELRNGEAISNAATILVCIHGGEDLRLGEISEIMETLGANAGKGCRLRLGTVVDPDGLDILRVAVLVFENWTDAGVGGAGITVAERPTPRSERTSRGSGSKLSFGTTGRGRFRDIEATVMAGEDMDVPAYIRRGIVLEP